MAPFPHSYLARKERGNREAPMALECGWHESYKAALLETDWTQILRRIQEAESTIVERKHVLSLDHGGTPEERHALADALKALEVLRGEVDEWQNRRP